MTMQDKFWSWSLILSVAAIGFIAVANLAYIWTTDRTHPIDIKQVIPLNSPIVEGDVLLVRFVRDKNRDDCRLLTLRTATSLATGITTSLEVQMWKGSSSADNGLDVPYKTEILKPDKYIGRYDLTYFCPLGFTFNTKGDFFFEVVKGVKQ